MILATRPILSIVAAPRPIPEGPIPRSSADIGVAFGPVVDQIRVQSVQLPTRLSDSERPMNQARTSENRWERLIEAMDKPLLVLAVVTMVLYLSDLMGGLGRGRMGWLALS